MHQFFWQRGFAGWVVVLACSAAISAPLPAAPILDADFDDKTADAPIGTGGAAVGEPVSVPSNLDAVVRATPFATNSLEIRHDAATAAGSVRFEFQDSVEISTCQLRITGKLYFDILENGYTVRIREQASSTAVFLSLNFSSGGISAYDADSPSGMTIGTLETDTEIEFDLQFDLTAGTYDIRINGELLLEDEPHGVVGQGIGRVLLGMYNTTPVGPYWLDDLLVDDLDGLFCASFEGGDTDEWSLAQN